MQLKQNEQTLVIALDERLSFRSHETIDEIISIAIDPDIVIHSYEEYIQIRGVISLVGEYKPMFSDSRRDDDLGKEKGENFIEKVIFHEKDHASFTHRFPVEVSVAKERIQAVDDVYVTVEAFDYQLPNANLLQIHADVHIHGIQPEKEAQNDTEETTDKSLDRKLVTEDEGANQEEIEEKLKDEETLEETKLSTSPASHRRESTEGKKEKEEESPPSLPAQEVKETSFDEGDRNLTLITPTSKENEGEAREVSSNDEEDNGEIKGQKEKDVTEEVANEKEMEEAVGDEEDSVKDGADEVDEDDEMQIALSESDKDEEEIKGVSFLTDLFARESESYTRLTIYIAQENDSVESIAKRYEIPVLQLLKDNHLSGEQIEKGQLIMIQRKATTE